MRQLLNDLVGAGRKTSEIPMALSSSSDGNGAHTGPESPSVTPQPGERLVCHLAADAHLVTRSPNHEVGREKFLILRHRLSQIRRARQLKTLLVTSSIPQEGKTLVAVNLAATLALNSSRVLLIDADLRESSVHRILGLPALSGLAECLEGRTGLTTAVRRLDHLGISYIPAGRPTTSPVNLFQSRIMRDVLDEVASNFDWVIVDSPPLNPVADSHCLASVTDAVLLVARSGITPRPALLEALVALRGIFVAGMVFNAVTNAHASSYDSYYYGQGQTGATADAPMSAA